MEYDEVNNMRATVNENCSYFSFDSFIYSLISEKNERSLSFVIDLLIDIACGFMFHENEMKQRIETIEPNFENFRVFG